jgi:Dyp-type peroxidase family
MGAPVACEWTDVQGTVVSGYRRLLWARYLLAAIDDPARTRAWLARLLPSVTDAGARQSASAINVAFTHSGLLTLIDRPAEDLRNFNEPFVDGMTGNRHRMRVLGDVGDSDPLTWAWGGPSTRRTDLLVVVYGETKEALERAERAVDITSSGLTSVWTIDSYRPTDREPFGFADGLSQPLLEGTRQAEEQPDSLHAIRLGEVLLGYPDNAEIVEPVPSIPGCQDFGVNGTYLVARQMSQDVEAFWAFMRERSGPLGLSPEALASKIVGRALNGDPLIPGRGPNRCAATNEFGFMADDPHGEGCPLGSHIRRGNPRDMLGDTAAESWRIVNRHRVLRRGRPYLNERGDAAGLVFVALNADIERQFEFVQQNWINDTGFGELRHERDPLIGSRTADDDTFTIPAAPLRQRVHGMRSFIATRGGAYFFLPGLRALARIARA